jgi:hypothetical protein
LDSSAQVLLLLASSLHHGGQAYKHVPFGNLLIVDRTYEMETSRLLWKKHQIEEYRNAHGGDFPPLSCGQKLTKFFTRKDPYAHFFKGTIAPGKHSKRGA